MYEIFVSVINKGGWKLNDMLNRIEVYAVEGKLTIEEADKLKALAREKATVQDGTDIAAMMLDHEMRIRALEAAAPVDPDEPTEYPEYVPGKWYYAGDKVAFNGAVYECIAPEGVVCVWSPTEYPTYWQLVA